MMYIPFDDDMETPKPAPGDDGDRDEEDAEVEAPVVHFSVTALHEAAESTFPVRLHPDLRHYPGGE